MVNLALREVSNFRVRYGAWGERRTSLVTKLNVDASVKLKDAFCRLAAGYNFGGRLAAHSGWR
jgi:hypothetical protein